MRKPKFTIITPCRNAGSLLSETVASVINQSAVREGRVELQYLVCDGASTDGSMERLAARAPAVTILSEPDRGMYDALAKGLRRADSDYTAYLNAGDYYHPHAFDVVTDVLTQRPEVSWLTGYEVIYSPEGWLIRAELPPRYRRRLFGCAMHGWNGLRFLQQESTFWRSRLNGSLDLDRLSGFKLAGDYFMWSRFAESEEVWVVQAHLGGFRLHEGQLSENLEGYWAEVDSFRRRRTPLDWLLGRWDRLCWLMPSKVKPHVGGGRLLGRDHKSGRWH